MKGIAICGFGRIGRSTLRDALQEELFVPRAITDIKELGTLAALFEVDSNYGRWPEPVEALECGSLAVGSFSDLGVAVETNSVIELGRLLIESSLLREETRGCYWRLDHPEPDNSRWICNTVLARDGDGVAVRFDDVVFTRAIEPRLPRVGSGCFNYVSRDETP